MFYLMFTIGLIGLGFVFFSNIIAGRIAVIGAIFFASITIGSFSTAQGQMVFAKLSAGARTGNWLVIDNSGGETLRHWVIEGGYVESSDQSDGWQFYDSRGLCYVSGDAFVMKIESPLEEFLDHYKTDYSIPSDQPPLD